MSVDIPNTIVNSRIQQAYDVGVTTRADKVTKKANDAIKSFADLVDELSRLQSESKGTTVKEEVAKWASDMNNTSVMVTRLLEAQLQALHGIVRPEEEVTIKS